MTQVPKHGPKNQADNGGEEQVDGLVLRGSPVQDVVLHPRTPPPGESVSFTHRTNTGVAGLKHRSHLCSKCSAEVQATAGP